MGFGYARGYADGALEKVGDLKDALGCGDFALGKYRRAKEKVFGEAGERAWAEWMEDRVEDDQRERSAGVCGATVDADQRERSAGVSGACVEADQREQSGGVCGAGVHSSGQGEDWRGSDVEQEEGECEGEAERAATRRGSTASFSCEARGRGCQPVYGPGAGRGEGGNVHFSPSSTCSSFSRSSGEEEMSPDSGSAEATRGESGTSS
jgi:hypothetical protein